MTVAAMESFTSPSGVTVTQPVTGLAVRDYFDRSSKKHVKPAEKEEIDAARARYLAHAVVEPAPEMEVTDEQLSIILQLSKAGENLLGFDMELWAPFGALRQRAMTLATFKQTEGGGHSATIVPGPADLEEWQTAWDWAKRFWIYSDDVHHGIAL